MKICYVDEAGCCGALPEGKSDIQPVLVICGIIIDCSSLEAATLDFMNLKHRFYPGANGTKSTYLGRILSEIKGADLRRDLCKARRVRRTARGFLKEVLEVCSHSGVRIVGRVWIKMPGRTFNGTSVYAKSLQEIASHFQRYLELTNDYGMIIADSRTASLNGIMSHSIFTRKFKATGDEYNRIVELPTFGHSSNHAGIQIADLICSAILFPVAAWTYCRGHFETLHVRAGYDEIKRDYIPTLRQMQFRYKVQDGSLRGGVTVSDGIMQRGTSPLFELPPEQLRSSADLEHLPLFGKKVA